MKYPKLRDDVVVTWEVDEDGYFLVKNAIAEYKFDIDAASLAPYLDGETNPYQLGIELDIAPNDVEEILQELTKEGLVRRGRLGWNNSQLALTWWLRGDVSPRFRRWAQVLSRALLLLLIPAIVFLGVALTAVSRSSFIWFPPRFVWLGILVGIGWHEFCHYYVGAGQGRRPVEWGISAVPPEAYVLFQPMNKSPLEDCWLYLAGSAGNLVLAAVLFGIAELPLPINLWPVHAWKARAAGLGNILLAISNTLIGGRYCDGGKAFSALLGLQDIGSAVAEGIEREGDAFRERNFPVWFLSKLLAASKWVYLFLAYACILEGGL